MTIQSVWKEKKTIPKQKIWFASPFGTCTAPAVTNTRRIFYHTVIIFSILIFQKNIIKTAHMPINFLPSGAVNYTLDLGESEMAIFSNLCLARKKLKTF